MACYIMLDIGGSHITSGLANIQKDIKKIENLDSARVFRDVIHPILDARCVSCHNPEKKKGELLLTTYDELMTGGESGPLLQAGSADSSDLVHRLLLPEADDDHMPPQGKLQLTSDQIDLITWWINQGAPMEKTISEMQLSEEISEALNKLTVEGTSSLAKAEVPKADTSIINSLRRDGIKITPIAENKNFLQAKYFESADSVNLELLVPLSKQITWLDLAGSTITDRGIKPLQEFANLTRLNLENTEIGPLAHNELKNLEHLEYLNLYNTNVDNSGLTSLAPIKRLKSLYLWQTNVTEDGVENLKQQLPDLNVDTGCEDKRVSSVKVDTME